MKEFSLKHGFIALIDDEDFDYLSQWRWTINPYGYAQCGIRRNGQQETLLMHRVITKAPKGSVVDHINHNRLDNQKSNLRVGTKADNNQNLSPYRTGPDRKKRTR